MRHFTGEEMEEAMARWETPIPTIWPRAIRWEFQNDVSFMAITSQALAYKKSTQLFPRSTVGHHAQLQLLQAFLSTTATFWVPLLRYRSVDTDTAAYFSARLACSVLEAATKLEDGTLFKYAFSEKWGIPPADVPLPAANAVPHTSFSWERYLHQSVGDWGQLQSAVEALMDQHPVPFRPTPVWMGSHSSDPRLKPLTPPIFDRDCHLSIQQSLPPRRDIGRHLQVLNLFERDVYAPSSEPSWRQPGLLTGVFGDTTFGSFSSPRSQQVPEPNSASTPVQRRSHRVGESAAAGASPRPPPNKKLKTLVLGMTPPLDNSEISLVEFELRDSGNASGEHQSIPLDSRAASQARQIFRQMLRPPGIKQEVIELVDEDDVIPAPSAAQQRRQLATRAPSPGAREEPEPDEEEEEQNDDADATQEIIREHEDDSDHDDEGAAEGGNMNQEEDEGPRDDNHQEDGDEDDEQQPEDGHGDAPEEANITVVHRSATSRDHTPPPSPPASTSPPPAVSTAVLPELPSPSTSPPRRSSTPAPPEVSTPAVTSAPQSSTTTSLHVVSSASADVTRSTQPSTSASAAPAVPPTSQAQAGKQSFNTSLERKPLFAAFNTPQSSPERYYTRKTSSGKGSIVYNSPEDPIVGVKPLFTSQLKCRNPPSVQSDCWSTLTPSISHDLELGPEILSLDAGIDFDDEYSSPEVSKPIMSPLARPPSTTSSSLPAIPPLMSRRCSPPSRGRFKKPEARRPSRAPRNTPASANVNRRSKSAQMRIQF